MTYLSSVTHLNRKYYKSEKRCQNAFMAATAFQIQNPDILMWLNKVAGTDSRQEVGVSANEVKLVVKGKMSSDFILIQL